MNKNKEWLKKQLGNYKDGVVSRSFNEYAKGLKQAYETADYLIDQLDEPEKVVIPDFVADFIKSFFLEGGNKWGLLGVVTNMTFSNVSIADKDLFDWLQSGNGNRFIDAVRNGYTVAKEKKYRLKLNAPILGFSEVGYLNKHKDLNRCFLGNKEEPKFYQTVFTESELSQIDETGFVREEVAE